MRMKERHQVISLLQHCTVLLTFGIESPIIGVAIIITIVNNCNTWIRGAGRYIAIISLFRSLRPLSSEIHTNF